MSKGIADISMSLDGYVTAPGVDQEHGLGIGGERILVAPDGLGPLLMLWNATIVFLPFPTSLLADSGSQALVKLLYIGTITLNVALLSVIDLLVQRDPSGDGWPGTA